MADRRSGDSPDHLTPEQRDKIAAFRARHRTPEARSQERAVREAIRAEFPPAEIDPATFEALRALKRAREDQGLSLSEIADRTGIDRGSISKLENGRQPNPTLGTLRRYAAAVGRRIELIVTDLDAGMTPPAK